MPRGRRFRWHPNWPMISTFIGILLACALYLLISLWSYMGQRYTVQEIMMPRGMDLFVLVWFFWFGASIGSFLNVVAWRMPRGRSINGLSACPFCTTKIKAYDNVPVFGWLNLRGRCRGCRLPIAARYPIVETLVGFSIMLVGFLECYDAGNNLPFNPSGSARPGPLRMPHITIAAVMTSVYHIAALTGVWAFTLVRFDGFRLPQRLVVFFLAAAVIPLIVWPDLQVVPWQLVAPVGWSGGDHLSALLFAIIGIVSACLIARVIGRHVCPAADPKVDPLGKDTGRLVDLIFVFAIPGIIVGWHALLAIALVATLAAMVLRRKFPVRNGYAWLISAVPWSMALHIAFWKALGGIAFWPAPNRSPWVFIVWMFALLILSSDLADPPAQAETGPPPDEDDEDVNEDIEPSPAT